MLLTAFVLVIAFVALSGMVARVTQLPAETRQSAERPILTESRSIANGLEELIDQLATVHGIDDPASNPDGDAVEALSFDFNDAVKHLDHIQSARGFGFEASPLVCTDRGNDGTGTHTIRLWMDFTLRSSETQVLRSVSVELDGIATTVNGNPCPDPGFAFEDANGDLLFDRTADGDAQIGVHVAGDVTTGRHTTQPGFGLVIPASLSISVSPSGSQSGLTGIVFEADSPTLIAADVDNPGGSAGDELHVHTDSGDLWIAGATLSVDGSDADLTLAGAGALHLEWATLTASSGGDACIGLHSSDASETLYVTDLFVDDSNDQIEVATGDGHFRGDADFRVVGTETQGGFATASCSI